MSQSSNITIPQGFNINTHVKLDDPGLAVIIFMKIADEIGLTPGELAETIRSGSYMMQQINPTRYVGDFLLELKDN